jgi:molybdopterin converting factor subunit 1
MQAAGADQITVLYFAWLRERVGCGEERVALPEGVDRVDRLVDWLAARSPGHAAAFERRAVVRCAVNQSFAAADGAIQPGDEVAFFPPVTGG